MDTEILRIIAFEITRRCRYNCKHCRANAGLRDNEQDLTTEQCKKIIASVAQFSKPVCILTGGEPMERSDIYEIIDYGRGQGLQMAMATCGYLLDDKTAAKLKEAGISALSFSLDGAMAETHDRFRQTSGAYDLVIKAAETAKRLSIRFQINTTVSKINVGEIDAIAALAEKLGAYCFDTFILVPTGRGRKLAAEILEPAEYEKLLKQLLELKLKSSIEIRVTCGPQFSRVCKQIKTKRPVVTASGCMAGRGFGFISYRGNVQTCGFLDVSAGNLIENGFDFGKIWIESEFLKKIRSVSAYKGNCGICEFAGCCGGCRARAYTMSGDWLAADPVCNYQPKKKICI
jgi:radical SAM protein with 4Fe4S-binding SPASM domain